MYFVFLLELGILFFVLIALAFSGLVAFGGFLLLLAFGGFCLVCVCFWLLLACGGFC